MSDEWLETIRELAHKSALGELLMIAPPGSAESDNMRRRLDLLADFAQYVVESVDDDELRAAKESRESFATGSRSEPPTPDRRTGPPDRRLNGHGLLWFGFEAERSSAPGRRSMDKYYRQEPRPPEDHCT